MLKSVLELWPVLGLALQGAAVWFVWTMRQLAKKEVTEMVAAAELKAAAALKEIEGDVETHERRLGRAESQIEEIRSDIEALPTKADFARLEGELKGVGREVTAANGGIQRIEGFFLKKGVESAS